MSFYFNFVHDVILDSAISTQRTFMGLNSSCPLLRGVRLMDVSYFVMVYSGTKY